MRWFVEKDLFLFIICEIILVKIEKNIQGWSSGGKGTCQGDSGGPLFYLNPSTNKYVLVGVTSFTSSNGCGLNGAQKYLTLFTCTLRIDCFKSD